VVTLASIRWPAAGARQAAVSKRRMQMQVPLKKILIQRSAKDEWPGAHWPQLWDNIQHFIDFIKQIPHAHKRTTLLFRSIPLILFVSSPSVRAGFEESLLPTRHLNGCGVADPTGSFLLNPAVRSAVDRISFSGTISRPFGLQELQRIGSDAAFSPGDWCCSAAIHSRGCSVYRETDSIIGVSASASRGFRAGIRLHHAQLNILNYGSAASWMLDAGIHWRIDAGLCWGWTMCNLSRARIGRCRETLPQTMQMGFALSRVKNLELCLDVFKDVRFPVDFRGQADWHPFECLHLRTGFCCAPFRWCCGLGLQCASITWDYGFLTHEYLGWTHQCSLTFRLKP